MIGSFSWVTSNAEIALFQKIAVDYISLSISSGDFEIVYISTSFMKLCNRKPALVVQNIYIYRIKVGPLFSNIK